MKAHHDQPAGHLLRRGIERLGTLPLAEVQLRRSRYGDLDDAVGQLPRLHLVEPDTVEAWMLGADGCENPFPGRGIKRQCFGRAAQRGLARRLSRYHGDLTL